MEHIKELLYKMADDQLIIGHRNSEWTGLGPILEEDIAFSSMAQDKIGQAQALYQILHTLGESHPDVLAFLRNSSQFHNCHFVEAPIGGYQFSLMRHYLFDHAEILRFESLSNSSFEPLAQVARKYKGEIKYHILHANTWIKQLSLANEEAHNKMQEALNQSWNGALGIFETGPFEELLISDQVFNGEDWLKNQWLEKILPFLEMCQLNIPEKSLWNPTYGGRKGIHSADLQPMLDEMTEVYQIDPSAEW